MAKVTFKKILLVYKKSNYSIYFPKGKTGPGRRPAGKLKKQIRRFKKAHEEHHASIQKAESLLKKYGFSYAKCARGRKIDYSRYDLVITLGGDGSFLETAFNVKKNVIIGINSSPKYSVGKLCLGNIDQFERIVKKIKRGDVDVVGWPRLRLDVKGHRRPVDCANDFLVAHADPAAMSRYLIKVGGTKEEQRNSGLWVATSAGSTGAINSAGGKSFKPDDKKIQYMPRELHYGFRRRYKLRGGVLKSPHSLTITSLMREGRIFVDGNHCKIRFPFNTRLKISFSPNPLKTLRLK